jgi:hypothetical protein
LYERWQIENKKWSRKTLAGGETAYSRYEQPPFPGEAIRYPQVFLTGGTTFPGCGKIFAQAKTIAKLILEGCQAERGTRTSSWKD